MDSTVKRVLPGRNRKAPVRFAEARDESESARPVQNLTESKPRLNMAKKTKRRTRGGKKQNVDSEFDPSHPPATSELGSCGLESGSSSSLESWTPPVQKTGHKRPRLNPSVSRKRRRPREDEDIKVSVKRNKQEESETDRKAEWEFKDIVSRDGKTKIQSSVFFASLDQRSERAAGEAACSVVAVVVAHWLHANPRVNPSREELDSLIIQGSSLWQFLCNKESYLRSFPDKHFDLESVVSANLRPIRICPEKSLIGAFSPERFDWLKGMLSFDEMWNEIKKNVESTGLGEPRIYIFGWNDHFFVLKGDHDGYYIIDSLGERLFEGCKEAYIIKFDDASVIYNNRDSKKNRRRNKENEEETMICSGKECCKEYIKRFLAAIAVAELEEEEKNGAILDVALLHKRLQIDLQHILTNS